jgi:acyl-[acyl-carrier-protein]-phospholipid O-acyltransferase/long-chain-fatty-acid--[acyl-carrier-protein] ligase
MKTFLRFLLRRLFAFRAYNEDVLKTPGPVLLLPSHVSWLDWLFLLASLDGGWKCIVSKRTAESSALHRFIMLNRFTYPIDTDSPYAVKRVAEYLNQGGRLILFPEGRLSQTGTLMKLYDGTGFLLHKTKARAITCFFRGAQFLPASPNPECKRWFPKVTTHFSEVLTPPVVEHTSTVKARAIYSNWLWDKMVNQRFEVEMEFGPKTIIEGIVEAAGRVPEKRAVEDLAGRFSFRELLVGAEVLAEQFELLLQPGVERVGVLLPNASAAPLALLGLWTLGKVPSLLNYSTGATVMQACIKVAGVRQVITSRTFLERARLDVSQLAGTGVEWIYLEDIKARVTGADKLGALRRVKGYLRGEPHPAALDPLHGGAERGEKTAAILFTSGSEGVPKAVGLSHTNILANVRQMLAVTDITGADRVFNAMPIFHSFGLTVGLLLPLLRGLYVYIYPSPLHFRAVPIAFYECDATIMIGTNTFLNGYGRKAHPYDFRSLRYMFAAAEKLQESTVNLWARRYGVRVLEGYGATECSPCVSANTPMQAKCGSAGRLMPGMEYRLETVEGVADGGRLWVRGPNVMKGYLGGTDGGPGSGVAVGAGGWYDTGDIVSLDAEGFLFVKGRLKRFAKISGEMVSLTAVEDALAGAFPVYGLHCQLAVLTRADGNRGEVLVAATNEPRLTLEEVRAAVKAKNLPNIMAPRELVVVSEMPKLGTGKVNYRELERVLAERRAAAEAAAVPPGVS